MDAGQGIPGERIVAAHRGYDTGRTA
jgi:hypothetical protein